MSSAPGKVSLRETVKVVALVTAVDSGSRSVTLEGPDGKAFDVVAGDEVRNFAQIKTGDQVVVAYERAVSLELRKPGGALEHVESVGAARAMPGDRPAGVLGHQVTIFASVIGVDPLASTITLQGPKGRVVVLDVHNPDQFKVVRTGDQVEVDYVEAVAIAVEPAAK